jgi:DNA-binding PadR family transcriptional regulator
MKQLYINQIDKCMENSGQGISEEEFKVEITPSFWQGKPKKIVTVTDSGQELAAR